MYAYLRRIWLALLLAFAGCSPSSGLPVLAAKPEVWVYRLGPGDTLQIRVLSADELNGQYLVQDDGTVRMLMAGAIPAAGFTAEQVQTKIEDALKAGRFLTQPRVTVAVVNYRPYFILGEVSGPGAYPYVNGMRVLSAVAAAGGYTRRADQNFVIITRNGEDYRADFMAFIQPDDTIRVYERYLFANRIEFNVISISTASGLADGESRKTAIRRNEKAACAATADRFGLGRRRSILYRWESAAMVGKPPSTRLLRELSVVWPEPERR